MMYPTFFKIFHPITGEVSRAAPAGLQVLADRARSYLNDDTGQRAELLLLTLSLAVNQVIERKLEALESEEEGSWWIEEDNVGALMGLLHAGPLPDELDEPANTELFALLCLHEIGSAERWLSQAGKPGPFSERIFDAVEAHRYAAADMIRAAEALAQSDIYAQRSIVMNSASGVREQNFDEINRERYSQRALAQHRRPGGYNERMEAYCKEYRESPDLMAMPASKAAAILAEKHRFSPVTVVKKLRIIKSDQG